MRLEGTVAAGFESVQQLFEQRMHKLAERNAQLCVYVGDTRVVDLWGSAIDDDNFTPDSLVNVFSSGKSLEAILFAMLVDRGLLDYAAEVTDYWPEFGGNNKRCTVSQLMRHEAGLAAFDTTIEPADLHPDRLQENAIGALIERQEQRFRTGDNNQREYHAITRGWIANEIFRRVEPAGRTMGQFLRDEVSSEFDLDAHIGLQDDELSRVSKVAMLGFGYQFRQSFIPAFLGRKTDMNWAQATAKLWRLRAGVKDRTRGDAPTPVRGLQKISVFDSDAITQGETPSAGAKCSARGLAKLAAVMANGGALGDRQLLSSSAWTGMHDDPVRRNMIAMDTVFTQGGVARFGTESTGRMDQALNAGRDGFVGWMGLGGSIFQWHPEHKIGFSYVPTSLNVLDVVNERGKTYQAEILRCVA